MADILLPILLPISLLLLSTGLHLSAFITSRDGRALREVHPSLYRWQIALVVSDVVQNTLLFCTMGLIAFLLFGNHRMNGAESPLSWTGLTTSWTLQSMFYTSVRSPT